MALKFSLSRSLLSVMMELEFMFWLRLVLDPLKDMSFTDFLRLDGFYRRESLSARVFTATD